MSLLEALARRPFWATTFRVLVALAGWFLGEVLSLSWDAGWPDARQTWLGVGTGYALVMLVGLLPALASGSLAFGLSRFGPPSGSTFGRLRGFVSPADLRVARARSAGLFALASSTLVPLAFGYFASLEVVLRVVRPPNQALVLAVLQLCGALLWLGAFVGLRALFVRLLALVARRFAGESLLDRPHWALLLVALGVLLGASALAFVLRATLAELPWASFVQPAVAFSCALVLFALASGRRGIALGLAVSLACLVSLVAPSRLKPADHRAVALFDESLIGASFASRLLTRAFDRDGDGHRAFLGGGDCNDRDRRVHPGAADVPDDGKDQDCDGKDLKIPALLAERTPPSHPVPATVPAKPDVVLITIDAFAASHLKAFGYPHETTPNLEKLFRRGVLFEHCFAQGPSTRLSFPAMFTSRYDAEIDSELVGRHPYPMLRTNFMLAEAFKQQGYRTAAVLPTRYFMPSSWKGLTQGFDTVDSSATTQKAGGAPFNADKVVDAALALLPKGAGDGSLFMWVHLFDAHAPHAVPPGETARGSAFPDVYDAELTFLDRHLGRLVERIESELGPDTLIVVTADHGHGFGGARYARGAYGYDLNTLTLHVPTVFAAGFLPAARRSSLCSTLDIFPTLLDLIRAPLRKGMRGYSLVPELFEGRVARPQVMFHEQFLPERLWKDADPLAIVSVRTPDYNYVLNRLTGTANLWKWSGDYEEQEDLLGTARVAPSVRAELAHLLSAFVYRSLAQSHVRRTTGRTAKRAPEPQADHSPEP